CTSDDPRDNRLRTSALLSFDGRNVLIDASPDLRTQALTYGISTLDAVLCTHDHADHTFGVDDLRAYNLRRRGRLPCYGDAATLASIRERFNYIFSSTPALGSRPRLDLCEVDGPFDLWGRTIIPLDVYHGDQTITSYRIGDFGYVTDASALPDVTIETLRGVRYLALNALRHEPHPLHLNLRRRRRSQRSSAPRRPTYYTWATRSVTEYQR
ncbi:MAG: MBL fold metallo-hydrolase, partial [Chloroflexia bacterium]